MYIVDLFNWFFLPVLIVIDLQLSYLALMFDLILVYKIQIIIFWLYDSVLYNISNVIYM